MATLRVSIVVGEVFVNDAHDIVIEILVTLAN